MMFQKIISTCCKSDQSRMPVLPPRRFESIPDETIFGKQLNVRLLKDSHEKHKPVFRNRMIILGIMALIVMYFKMKYTKK